MCLWAELQESVGVQAAEETVQINKKTSFKK